MNGSFTKKVVWYSAGNIFIRSASFLLLPLYSNFIVPSDFGIYSVIMSFYAVLSVFFQGGLQSALSKFYIEREEKTEIFSVIINFIIVWGAVLLILILFFSSTISDLLLGKNFNLLIQLIAISLYVETIAFFILHLFKTKEEASRAVIYTAAGAVMNILLNVYFVYYLQERIEGIIKAQLFSSVLTLTILLPYFKQNYKFRREHFTQPAFFKPLFLFSLPVFLSGFFSSLVDVADRFIINNYLGEEQTGIYSFAYRIALVMNIFVIAFRTAFTPYSIKLYNTGDYQSKFGNIFTNLLAAGGLIILAVSFFADDLFNLKISGFTFFTAQYEGGIFVLPLILTGYFFSAVMSFYSVYPYVSGKSYHFLISDVLAFGTNIILNFILIPSVGIKGAAIATLLAFLAGAVYLFFISSSKIKIEYRKGQIITVILSAAIMLTAGLLVDKLFADIIFILMYIFIVFVFGRISISVFRLKSD